LLPIPRPREIKKSIAFKVGDGSGRRVVQWLQPDIRNALRIFAGEGERLAVRRKTNFPEGNRRHVEAVHKGAALGGNDAYLRVIACSATFSVKECHVLSVGRNHRVEAVPFEELLRRATIEFDSPDRLFTTFRRNVRKPLPVWRAGWVLVQRALCDLSQVVAIAVDAPNVKGIPGMQAAKNDVLAIAAGT
jgi:hypothetical protein